MDRIPILLLCMHKCTMSCTLIATSFFQQVSSRRPSNGTLGSWYSRTPFSWSVGLEETCLVEQAASCLNKLGFINNGRGRIYSDEWEEEKEEDMELSLSTLLDFGRQLTLGMVCIPTLHGVSERAFPL